MPTISLEIEISFEGTYSPGRSVTPPEGPEYEVTKVTKVTYSKLVYDQSYGGLCNKDFLLELNAAGLNSLLVVLNDEPLAEEVSEALASEAETDEREFEREQDEDSE